MNDCAARRSLLACVLGLRQCGAGGVGARLTLAAAAHQLSQVDAPERLAGLDARPFLHGQPTNVPGRRAPPRYRVPPAARESIVAGIVTHCGRTTSRASNSSVTAALSLSRCMLLRPTATAAAMPTTSATAVPMIRFAVASVPGTVRSGASLG
jgi:hypothetical protein